MGKIIIPNCIATKAESAILLYCVIEAEDTYCTARLTSTPSYNKTDYNAVFSQFHTTVMQNFHFISNDFLEKIL